MIKAGGTHITDERTIHVQVLPAALRIERIAATAGGLQLHTATAPCALQLQVAYTCATQAAGFEIRAALGEPESDMNIDG